MVRSSRSAVSEIPDVTCYVTDRTDPSSFCTSSGRYIILLAHGIIPRSAWGTTPLSRSKLFVLFSLNLFTDCEGSKKCSPRWGAAVLCWNCTFRCIAGYYVQVLLIMFFLFSSDIFISLRYVVSAHIAWRADVTPIQSICDKLWKQNTHCVL